MSEVKVSKEFLIAVYDALDYLPTSKDSADLYKRQQSARDGVNALLHFDAAEIQPIDYAARYGLHGMSAIDFAKLLVDLLLPYSEMGAVLDAWRIANAPQPEPDMFWPLHDADGVSAMDLQQLIDEAEEDGCLLEVSCAKSMPPRKIRAWRDDDDDETQHWEWVDETPNKSTNLKMEIDMETEHSPTPWTRSGRYIEDADGKTVADTLVICGSHTAMMYANADRIVACVNACEGVSNEQLVSMSVADLVAQRDELLAAMRQIAIMPAAMHNIEAAGKMSKMAWAAVAKAEGVKL